jgi:hypothetical protein
MGYQAGGFTLELFWLWRLNVHFVKIPEMGFYIASAHSNMNKIIAIREPRRRKSHSDSFSTLFFCNPFPELVAALRKGYKP